MWTVLGAVATWVLAAVFLWSGATKLHRPRLAAMAMVDFGVVRRPVRVLGVLLGATEAVLGLALVAGVQTATALGVATLLLVVFAVLVARGLRAGAAFPCRCFGSEDKTISRATLARTGGLAAGAAVLWLAVLAGALDGRVVAAEVPLRAVAAVGLVAAATLLSRVPEVLGWNAEILHTFHLLAEPTAQVGPDPDGGPRAEGRTVLPLREVTKS